MSIKNRAILGRSEAANKQYFNLGLKHNFMLFQCHIAWTKTWEWSNNDKWAISMVWLRQQLLWPLKNVNLNLLIILYIRRDQHNFLGKSFTVSNVITLVLRYYDFFFDIFFEKSDFFSCCHMRCVGAIKKITIWLWWQ